MEHKKLIFTIIAITVVSTLLAVAGYQKLATSKDQTNTTTPEAPKKTDFGAKTPDGFPKDIPLENTTSLNQSYLLDYGAQKQSTVVFPTTKTVRENYAFYENLLKEQGWNIANKYESKTVSSLYGTKENSEINVTITEKEVSVSVLKK